MVLAPRDSARGSSLKSIELGRAGELCWLPLPFMLRLRLPFVLPWMLLVSAPRDSGRRSPLKSIAFGRAGELCGLPMPFMLPCMLLIFAPRDDVRGSPLKSNAFGRAGELCGLLLPLPFILPFIRLPALPFIIPLLGRLGGISTPCLSYWRGVSLCRSVTDVRRVAFDIICPSGSHAACC